MFDLLLNDVIIFWGVLIFYGCFSQFRVCFPSFMVFLRDANNLYFICKQKVKKKQHICLTFKKKHLQKGFGDITYGSCCFVVVAPFYDVNFREDLFSPFFAFVGWKTVKQQAHHSFSLHCCKHIWKLSYKMMCYICRCNICLALQCHKHDVHKLSGHALASFSFCFYFSLICLIFLPLAGRWILSWWRKDLHLLFPQY